MEHKNFLEDAGVLDLPDTLRSAVFRFYDTEIGQYLLDKEIGDVFSLFTRRGESPKKNRKFVAAISEYNILYTFTIANFGSDIVASDTKVFYSCTAVYSDTNTPCDVVCLNDTADEEEFNKCAAVVFSRCKPEQTETTPRVLFAAKERFHKTRVGQYLLARGLHGDYTKTANRDGSCFNVFKTTLVLEDGMYVFQFDTTTNSILTNTKVNYQFTYWPNKQNPAIHKALPYDVYPGLTEEKFYDIAERHLKHVLVDLH